MMYFLGYSKNDEVRRYSSSGGFTKEIMAHALISGKVDKMIFPVMNGLDPEVIVTDDPRAIFTPNTNSIYQPVSPLSGLKKLEEGETCAITLLGCHVEVAPMEKCGLVIELMCKRLPTIGWTEEILLSNGVDKSEVDDFHYRSGLWPGLGHIQLKDGSCGKFDFRDAWRTGEHDTQPKKCLTCKRFNSSPHLSVGDPWRLMPMFDPQESGKTFVMVNDPKIVTWLSEANVVLEELSESKAEKCLAPHCHAKRNR